MLLNKHHTRQNSTFTLSVTFSTPFPFFAYFFPGPIRTSTRMNHMHVARLLFLSGVLFYYLFIWRLCSRMYIILCMWWCGFLFSHLRPGKLLLLLRLHKLACLCAWFWFYRMVREGEMKQEIVSFFIGYIVIWREVQVGLAWLNSANSTMRRTTTLTLLALSSGSDSQS